MRRARQPVPFRCRQHRQHLLPPPRRLPRRYWSEFSVFLGTVHALGYRLGLQLYHAFEQEIVSREEVRALFGMNFEEPGSAQRTYFQLLRRLRRWPA